LQSAALNCYQKIRTGAANLIDEILEYSRLTLYGIR